MPTTNIKTSRSKNGYNICHASHKRKRCFANFISVTIYGDEIQSWNFSCMKGFSSYNHKHGVKMWSFFHGRSPRLNANYLGMESCS
jgi:hypothetical protein